MGTGLGIVNEKSSQKIDLIMLWVYMATGQLRSFLSILSQSYRNRGQAMNASSSVERTFRGEKGLFFVK